MAYRTGFNAKFGELGSEVAQRFPEAKVIANKGKRKDTLGLALSGGGYRSAIFGYGVLKGLFKIGLVPQIDYLSAVSGGSWIATPFSTTDDFRWFFDEIPDHANLIEEGFESLLVNPARVLSELALDRSNRNSVSDLFGRLLAKTFLREHGQQSRFRSLSDDALVKDADRPYLILNGTVHFRRPGSFDIASECFEMTRLYSGSRTLGWLDSSELLALDKPLRLRDAIAVSGAAVAVHIPGLGSEVKGLGLTRVVENYPTRPGAAPAPIVQAGNLDVSDGGHYENLAIESLIHRGCSQIVVIDAEHDPERRDGPRSNQRYDGLRSLLRRHHVSMPFGQDVDRVIQTLDAADECVHVFDGDPHVPDVLYVKLKSWRKFDELVAVKPYNRPGFLGRVLGNGGFRFDPQFSTSKLDYDFAEHRNLSDLGTFIVEQHAAAFAEFAARST